MPVSSTAIRRIIVVALALIIGAFVVSILNADAARHPIKVPAEIAAEDTDHLNLRVARPEHGQLRVFFAGDSLTYGWYASVQKRGYRPVMVDALGKDGPVKEYHGEFPGATTSEVSQFLVVPPGLDVAIVELGTNDVARQTPIEAFTDTYAALLDKVRAGSPGVPLMCVGTWGSDGGGFGSDIYNAVIHSECAERGGAFVSLYDLYAVSANRGPTGAEAFGGVSDGFHPNDRGHREIARLLLSRLDLHPGT